MSSKYVFTTTLKELRFHLCHSSEQSSSLRTFLSRAYPTMKKNNPYTPIMIREASAVEPKIWARYEFGREKVESLSGLNDKQIEAKVAALVKNEA